MKQEHRLKFVQGVVVICLVLPAFGQYAGPAILARGEAPAAMATPTITFRPYVELTSIYDTGLADVGVTDQGTLASKNGVGMQFAWGLTGAHSWPHTRVGVDYHGGYNHFASDAAFDSLDQTVLLGVTHAFSRHATLSLRESAGWLTRGFGLNQLSSTVPFDPSSTYTPMTDFFDNRTAYTSTQADFTYQKSVRLSFDMGGDGFVTSRRSSALYGVVGAAARGDIEYRLTRATTVGIAYTYSHFDFTRIFGGTDLHGIAVAYAVQLTRRLEFSGFAGAMRVESKFVQAVAIDPVIAALLGVQQASEVVYTTNYVPNFSGRLSETFRRGVAYISAGHTVTPGNGLFLTSYGTSVMAGYTYTGLRRWSFSANVAYSRMNSVGNINGTYGGETGALSASRQVGRYTHLLASLSARQYSSPNFSQYNRLIYTARLGIGFSPGELPLRFW